MDESKEFIPSLTLDPNAASASAVAAELGVDEPKAPVLEEKKDVPVEKLELERLSPAEQAAVKEFAKQIDVTNSEQVLNYGSAAQKNIADFSDAALSKVRTKDLGEVGEELSDLVVQLQGMNFDEEEKKGFLGFFKKQRQSIAALKAQNIQTRPVWALIHEQADYGRNETYGLAMAEDFRAKIVNLPCSTNLTREDAQRVVDALLAL